MRYEYSDFFQVHPDGSVTSEFPVRVYGFPTTMSPGTHFQPGFLFEGFDIAGLAGHDLKVTIHEEHGAEVVVISKFY